MCRGAAEEVQGFEAAKPTKPKGFGAHAKQPSKGGGVGGGT